MDLTAVDISTQALAVAKRNAKLHNVTINFYTSNLLSSVNGQYDIIFANLPYVPLTAYEKLANSLQHEPRLAITTEDNVWDIHRRFLAQLTEHFTHESVVFLEIDPHQKIICKNIKQLFPTAVVTFAKDIHNLWCYAVITLLPKNP